MKVLLVNGSPNKDGCTNAALQEIVGELQRQGVETEIFWLGRKAISGCIACRSCAETGECVMDDAVNAFRAKAKEADGFIFGSPVHYAAASGSLTSFMDRLFFSDSGETFRLKPAAAVAVARAAVQRRRWIRSTSILPSARCRRWARATGIWCTG